MTLELQQLFGSETVSIIEFERCVIHKILQREWSVKRIDYFFDKNTHTFSLRKHLGSASEKKGKNLFQTKVKHPPLFT